MLEKNFDGFVESLSNITFVSFNYDRCIAQYILFAARDYFNLDAAGVALVLEAIDVTHPYGSLGDLDVRSGVIRGFGEEAEYFEFSIFADRIRTFTEQVEDSVVQTRIWESLESAEVVIFLGFGFNPLNLEFLFGDHRFRVPHVLATTLGVSNESVRLIRSELSELLIEGYPFAGIEENGEIWTTPTTCTELFLQYQRF